MVCICQYIQCTDPFSGCNFSCCRLFRRRVSDTLGLRFPILNFAVGVDGNPQPCCFRYILDWGNSFYVTLYMWFTSVINPSSTVCVSIPIQGWHLSTETWSIRVRSLQDGIRAHVDRRTWPLETGKPIGKIFSTTSFSKDLLLLFSSELIQKFLFSETIPFPLLTTRRFNWWDHSKKYKISDN